MSARPLSKTHYWFDYAGAMIFVIFIGFPISFTLIFWPLCLVFGVQLQTHNAFDDAEHQFYNAERPTYGGASFHLDGYRHGSGGSHGASYSLLSK